MSKNKKATIYDISRRLNISAATVSRALNNNPKISPKTRTKVLETAKELNYTQNRVAAALKQGKSNNVGVIVPYLNRNFFSSIIRGIEEELRPHGFHVIICQSHENAKNEAEQVKALLNTQIDAIFMSVSKETKNIDHINEVLRQKTPIIFFDRQIDIPNVSSVVLDDYQGGYIATEHLIEQGCRKIAFFSGDLNLEIYRNRYDGYISALQKYGLQSYSNYIIRTESTVQSGIDAVNKIWELEDKPDAIFATGDYTALGAIRQLKKLKFNIPQDVCVIGFSNEPFTKYMELTMSSIDQTPLIMGKKAALLFLREIETAESSSSKKKTVIPPQLIVRASSKR